LPLPALVLVIGAARVVAVGQEFIPLESWSYRAVERFEALGLCVVPADRPLSRAEFIDLTEAISSAGFDRSLSTRDRYNLERLEMEYTESASRRDPRNRYDPPTLYVPDAPLLLEGDVDVVPSFEKTALGDVGEAYLRSNPDFKLHAGDRVTYNVRYRWAFGPEHGDRARNMKPSRRERSFKGLTSLFERSYVIAAWEKVHAFVGRETVDWGPAPWGSLLTPGESLSLDQIGVRVRLKSFRVSAFIAQLSPVSRRYLAGHRLEVRWNRTVFGVSETAIYHGKQIDPIYAFPLSSFYANQFNERDDDNILWSLDAKTSLFERMTVYGSLLIDDFQFEREGDPDKIAFDVGGTYALGAPLGATLRAVYRYVDAFTYTHRDTLTRYAGGEAALDEGDVVLGGAPGPDSDSWRVELEVFPRRNVVATGTVAGTRRGEGQDFRTHVPGEDPNPPFPIPVVERTLDVSIALKYEFNRNRYAVGEFGYRRVDDAGHVEGVDDSGSSFRLAVHWELL
jgi:hypothetical protein